MSTFDSQKEDVQYLILRQRFESLQTMVVSRRNTILALKTDIKITTQRLNQEEASLTKNEMELKRLRALLHPDEQ
ncbi:MAG: hypothetical protein AAB770_00965 [Patescibacteria group bacterium]